MTINQLRDADLEFNDLLKQSMNELYEAGPEYRRGEAEILSKLMEAHIDEMKIQSGDRKDAANIELELKKLELEERRLEQEQRKIEIEEKRLENEDKRMETERAMHEEAQAMEEKKMLNDRILAVIEGGIRLLTAGVGTWQVIAFLKEHRRELAAVMEFSKDGLITDPILKKALDLKDSLKFIK